MSHSSATGVPPVSTPSPSQTESPAAPGHNPRRWWLLAIVALAQLTVVLDGTIVNIALPHAQSDLGMSDGDRTWVVTLYALVFGALTIVASDRTVTWRGQPCVLSNTEYKLLLVLAEAAGQVLSRDALLKKMRGIEFDGLDRSIDNCISKLRRKFDDAKSEKIKTVWGEGYLFSPSAWG